MKKRKIILNLCTSLDGFIEGSNGEIDWCFTDQDYGMTDFLKQIDTIFIGRKSYEQLKQISPKSFEDKQKIVFSKSLKNSETSLRVVSDNIKKEVKKIQYEMGKDIWLFGGANLTSFMLKHNLIDETIISVHPLILGAGKPLFISIEKRKKLKLKDVKSFSTGLVQLFYEVKKG